MKPKKVKLDTPQSVKLFTQEGYTYYSAKTHSKDSRCIVIVDEEKNLKQCLSARCKDARAAYVNSGKAEEFSCSHIDHCKSAISPLSVYHLSNELINNYPCDEAIKSSLNQLKEPSIGPAAFQVSKISYCVNGVATASNSVGYCHVKKVDSSFVCSSSDCGQYASKTKGSKNGKLCLHIHVLLCIFHSERESSISSTLPEYSIDAPLPTACSATASSGCDNHAQSTCTSTLACSTSLHQHTKAVTSSENDDLQTPSFSSSSPAPIDSSAVFECAESEGRLSTMKLNMLRSITPANFQANL